MRKTFTFLLGLFLSAFVFAQKPEAVVMKASVPPIVDGQIDEVWLEANEYNIDKNFQQEIPTLGESGETTWKALWTEEGMYLLLQVTDDVYYPSWVSGGANSWQYDKPEVYFDVNYILEDGLGCEGNVNQGHYQFDIAMTEATVNGERTEINEEKNGLPFVYVNAFLVEDPNYVAEYFFPFLGFVNKDGGPIDLAGNTGFDVTIIDNDPPGGDNDRQRAVWANMGAINESWANMDDAGIITFDGAEPPVYVEEIKIYSEGDITEDNQTVQMRAEILPEDASTNLVKWTLKSVDGGRARAKISPTGLITPVIDEIIVVQATSLDGFVYSNEIGVIISGQVPTIDELNYIGNAHFDDYNPDTNVAGPPWSGDGIVVNGVCTMTNPNIGENPWDWTFGQVVNVPFDIKNEKFVYSFRMWADADREVVMDFEDTANDYSRYGVSTDSTATRSGGGVTDWLFNITTEPQTYTFTCTFENMLPTAVQKMNFMLGWDTPTVYVDSVYLLSENDMALIPPTSTKELTVDDAFKVYPNPASSKLHVEFASPNTVVAIYNSVGIKMDQAELFGTHHVFDVSTYPKGMYFVKAKDSVVRFIK